MQLSLVLACYRDAPHLHAHAWKLIRLLEGNDLPFELIFVNDGCLDDGPELARFEASAREAGVPLRVLTHEKNKGRGAALRTGFLAARGEICAFIDIDLEPDPGALIPAIGLVQAGADVVVGRRIFRQENFLLKRYVLHYGHRFLVRLLLNLKARDPHAGLKAFRRIPLLRLLSLTRDERWFWDTEILGNAQLVELRIEEVPVAYCTRADKQSTVKFGTDTLKELTALVLFAFKFRGAQLKKLLGFSGLQSKIDC